MTTTAIDLRWTSAAKNIDMHIRVAQDLAAAVADDEAQDDEVREIFSALYSALRKARSDSHNAQVALGMTDPLEV